MKVKNMKYFLIVGKKYMDFTQIDEESLKIY